MLFFFNFLCSADINLSCIRNLDVSCESGVGQEHDADSFLKKLFEVPSLRSLEVINVRNSNITIETLKILKNKDKFDSYLIRNSELVSYYNGWKLAPIYINQVENTPITKCEFCQKNELQQPASKRLRIAYADKKFDQGYAHIQVSLKR